MLRELAFTTALLTAIAAIVDDASAQLGETSSDSSTSGTTGSLKVGIVYPFTLYKQS